MRIFRFASRHLATVLLFALVAGLLTGDQVRERAICVRFDPLDGLGNGFENLCLAILVASTAFGADPFPTSPGSPGLSSLPIQFERNVGQVKESFEFVARGQGQTILLDRGAATLLVRDSRSSVASLRATLAGSSPSPVAETEQPLPGRSNFFVGSDPSQWITGVPSFGRVRYRDVYPGVDVVYYGNGAQLEHDFVIHPGVDPSVIQVRFEGASSIEISRDGDAHLEVSGQEIIWRKPVLYQSYGPARRPVEGRYQVDGATLRFEVGAFDPDRPLVIDPVIAWSTFVGQSTEDGGGRVAVDRQGNVYLIGFTIDSSFPVTPGAFQPLRGSGASGNLFVTKLNAAGTERVYSTHIGGLSVDGGLGIAVDAQGNAYLTGGSTSADFPTTPLSLKPLLNRPGTPIAQSDLLDCFVTKLSPSGDSLVYSTFLGGTQTDACMAVAVDSAGAAHLAGWTNSHDFPVTETAAQRQFLGGSDAFIAKINPAGAAIEWATLLGGTVMESPTSIALDAAGAAYIGGHTRSSFRFPVTAGAPQRNYAGSQLQSPTSGDGFVAKVNPGGESFAYVTYLGGRSDDIVMDIAVDAMGNAYVAGSTQSDNFPIAGQPFQRSFAGTGGNAAFPGGDAFVAKLNPSGTAWLWSTFLGGSRDDWATSIALDANGKLWVAGATLSTNFPVSTDAQQSASAGNNPSDLFATGDAFIAQLNETGTALGYSSYLGGSGSDYALGLALDGRGGLIVSGGTLSGNFPVTANASQRFYGGTTAVRFPLGDAFVTRIGDASTTPPPTPAVSVASIVSAASYAGGGVAPGEIVVLTGAGLGPERLAGPGISADGTRLATTVAETRVLFDATPAPLVYVSAGQTSAIVPYGLAGRDSTQVVVEFGANRSAPITVPLAAAKPALFSADSSGRGPGAILNQDGSLNTSANPAGSGNIVVLYGTGEGRTDPAGQDGRLAFSIFPKPVLQASVTIGGQPAEVLYFGAAPQQVAGLFQANVRVPGGLAAGPHEVRVTVGGFTSQSGLTLAVQ